MSETNLIPEMQTWNRQRPGIEQRFNAAITHIQDDLMGLEPLDSPLWEKARDEAIYWALRAARPGATSATIVLDGPLVVRVELNGGLHPFFRAGAEEHSLRRRLEQVIGACGVEPSFGTPRFEDGELVKEVQIRLGP